MKISRVAFVSCRNVDNSNRGVGDYFVFNMDFSDSIRPRRPLHSRAWQLNALENLTLVPKQMSAVQPESGSVELFHKSHPSQNLYTGPDGVIRYPISVITQEMSHKDEKLKETDEKKDNICKRIIISVHNALDEYFVSSTLHGLKYVGDDSLSTFERLYWLAAFIAGLCFAAYFIVSIYAKFETSPMVISFNPKLVFINTIPFPAITICNVNLALRSKAIEIERNGNATQRELLGDLCNSQYGQHADEINAANATDWHTIQAFTVNVNQKCDDLVKVCKWNGVIVKCNDFINSVLTDEGYCCAFNQLPLNMTLRGNFSDRGSFPKKIINWNAEYGYDDSDNDTYPFRATGQGQALGLSLVLDAQLAEYHCTSTNSIGFKMLLSAPNERPRVADVGFLLSPGVEARITILPDVKDATEGVKNIHIDKRQCYFARERHLKFFLVYTEKNCRLECISNYTMERCNCVPYYLPRNPENPICDRSKEECSNLAISVIDRFTPERLACRCLPSCHDISYKQDGMSTGSIEAKYDTVNQDLLENVSTQYFSENMAVAHFYFEMDKYTKQTKSEMYGFSEFLSNTGGLLGLFLGFSFLSAMEIVYFILFRGQFRYYRRYKARRLKEKREKEKTWASLPYTQ
ncbi:pickpocket protein 28-like isoform X2 [Atheta coriaria]|uniref:pickpocket protein 28-like isoform X2 n=1 Tax=Dalotia coriaria TaxID=877792 RepID=UPI0031F37735